MESLAKMLVVFGALLLVGGGALLLLARMGFRGMPGDIVYRGQNTSFYFPIVTCVVISAVATLIMWLWQWLSHR